MHPASWEEYIRTMAPNIGMPGMGLPCGGWSKVEMAMWLALNRHLVAHVLVIKQWSSVAHLLITKHSPALTCHSPFIAIPKRWLIASIKQGQWQGVEASTSTTNRWQQQKQSNSWNQVMLSAWKTCLRYHRFWWPYYLRSFSAKKF